MIKPSPKYHIIGAGIAGLSVANLIKAKHPNSSIIVYEASSHLGGRCYSFYDQRLGVEIDNATHVVLGANTNTAQFLDKKQFQKHVPFYDYVNRRINPNLRKSINDIALAIFNLPLQKVAKPLLLVVLRKLFPFTQNRLMAWFSGGNLNSKLIEPLSKDITVKKGWKLKSFSENNGFIYKLHFNKGNIALLPKDQIISALDAHHYQQIFGGETFEYNEIINIFYRTSMQISLPCNSKILGIGGALAQWIFSSPGILAITISDASNIKDDNATLARKVWVEIANIRGHKAAFLPVYRVLHHKRATIRQDAINNSKRPDNCHTKWSNLHICGDWTLKNWPCSIEAALVSAKRVTKNL